MARSRLINPAQDLIADEGAVLWSFVRGEQLEFPVTLNFVENAAAGYTYECVVVEALNVAGQASEPTAVRPDGVIEQLNIRVPVYRGSWNSTQAYNREEVVLYAGVYYKLLTGVAQTDSTPPNASTLWTTTTLNKVYLQFPKTLGSTWAVLPQIGGPVYGFFELRVTEPQDGIFRRTWKPVRGLVELLYSPSYSSDD